MSLSAGSLQPGFGDRPEIDFWLTGGAVVVALHIAIFFGLGALTPRQAPPAPAPALNVDLAPFTIPAAVEQDHELLTASAPAGSALAPVRQSGSAAAPAPDRASPVRAAPALVSPVRAPPVPASPVRAPRTVAEAIAAADAVEHAADRVRPVAQDETASVTPPERAEPADGPRDVAEAIAAAETPPRAQSPDRMAPAETAPEPAARAKPTAEPLALTPTATAPARPAAPASARRIEPDTVLAGAEVGDPAPDPAMPDPVMPDIVDRIPAARPGEPAAQAEPPVSRRALLRQQAAARAAEARAERQRAARVAPPAAAAPAARPAPKAAATATAQPQTALRGPQTQAVQTEGTGRPFRASRPAPADPATWQRGIASLLNRGKSCPAPAGTAKHSGTVQLRFAVDASGRIGAITVARSSGNPAFDRAALDRARYASPLTRPPNGRAVSVTVSVRFAC